MKNVRVVLSQDRRKATVYFLLTGKTFYLSSDRGEVLMLLDMILGLDF